VKLLEELTATPAVPGREHRIRKLIEKHVKPLVDEIRIDAMGNLIAVRHPRTGSKSSKSRKASSRSKSSPTRLMLAAHMDQIGFIVRHIDDKGMVRVSPVGGFDTRNLFSRNCMVCTDSGDLPGVFNPGGKPVHIATEEERKKVPDISEFYIDLALEPKQVRDKVKVGDMAVLVSPFREVGSAVVSQCLDNRVGCWVLMRMLEKVKRHACEIHAVWTVQEEVGLRGAGPAAFGVEPDIAISCDTTLCCDTPGVPEDQQITRMGDGVAVKIMDGSTITDIELVREIEAVARKKRLKWQRSAMYRGGQDGAMLQRSRIGSRTAVMACPVRYIHTTVEMAAVSDINSYRDVLSAYVEQLK
jgi:endoglucanase